MNVSLFQILNSAAAAGIVSLVGILLNNKYQKKTALKLENNRVEQQLKKEKRDDLQNSKDRLSALMQKIKAITDFVLQCKADREKLIRYDMEMEDLMFEFNMEYGKCLSKFNWDESRCVHECKNHSFSIGYMIKTILRGANNEETDAIIKEMESMRLKISTYQTKLLFGSNLEHSES
jgi:hypothetical protein